MKRNLRDEFGQEEYNGGLENGQRTGHGRMRTPLYTYDGNWFENKRHGEGTADYTNGDIYKGTWLKDKMNGTGTFIKQRFLGKFSEKYVGDFVDDRKEGKGCQELLNGLVYQGSFLNDKFHGNGSLMDKNSSYIYNGGFVNGKKECSNGSETYKGGETYQGEFSNGMKHGIGVYKTKTDYIYHGNWRFGVRQGFGVEYNHPSIDVNQSEQYQFKASSILSDIKANVEKAIPPSYLYVNSHMQKRYIYEGEFWNGVWHGHGKLVEENQNYYVGGFIYGKKHGIGYTFTKEEEHWSLDLWSNGQVIESFETGQKTEPLVWSGYQEVLERGGMFEDKEFVLDPSEFAKEYRGSSEEAAKYYMLTTENLQKRGIDTSGIQCPSLAEIYPEYEFKILPVTFLNALEELSRWCRYGKDQG